MAKPDRKPAPRGAEKYRAAEIKKIQIAKRWAVATLPGFDDDQYRDLLHEAGGKSSSTELDWRGRMNVLKRFEELGWVAIPAKKAHTNPPSVPPCQGGNSAPPLKRGGGGGVCRRQADDDQSKMIRGLWIDLHILRAVRDPSEKALNSYVKRMTKIADLHWCKDNHKYTLIEALKDWRARTSLKLMQDYVHKVFLHVIPETLCTELKAVMRGLRIGEEPTSDAAYARLGSAGMQLLKEYKRFERITYQP